MENGYQDRCSCCSNSRIYEDFVPSSQLVHGKDYDTLLLNLPGFKKEEVKVQLCKTGILKISGQRPVNKYLSFQKDILGLTNCDKSKINARLVKGILYVKHPKLINSSDKNEKEFPTSTSEQEQDHKKTILDELSKQDNAECAPTKEEPKETSPKISEQLSKLDNAENSPTKQEPKDTSPRTSEQLSKQDNDENAPTKEEPKDTSPKISEQLSKQDNAENAPTIEEPKDKSPKISEQTQVKQEESKKDDTTRNASDLFAKFKVSRRVMNMALVALVVLVIGRSVVNMMRSPKKDKE